MKLRITYKELSILLGIVVAILAIFSYWFTLHQESPADATFQLNPMLDLEIAKLTKFFKTTLQIGLIH